MEPKITPIDAMLGAVITGVDRSRMDALTWKTVEQAFHKYAVGHGRGRASLQIPARQ